MSEFTISWKPNKLLFMFSEQNKINEKFIREQIFVYSAMKKFDHKVQIRNTSFFSICLWPPIPQSIPAELAIFGANEA